MTDRHEQGTAMDPAAFDELLSTSFGPEPPHPGIDADLSVGKRRLRRRRAGLGASAIATAAVVAAAALAVPALGGGGQTALQPAGGAGALSDQQIVDACLSSARLGGEMLEGHGRMSEAELVEGLQDLMAQPELMTSAETFEGVVATVRSGDGRYWEDCHLEADGSGGFDGYGSVYPTAVTFPRVTVEGQAAYDPGNEADSRFTGSATGPEPQYWVPCETTAPEETQAWRDELADCDRFTVTWNDRRPAEVAKVRIVTPDGVTSWADVNDGYLSFAYSAPMVEVVAHGLRSGQYADIDDESEVTFFDEDGEMLAEDQEWYGDGPRPLSIEHFPSLAYWLR